MKNAHYRTWNIARKLKKKTVKGDTNTVGYGIWRETLKNMENEKCTL